jgi:hypothetical protein
MHIMPSLPPTFPLRACMYRGSYANPHDQVGFGAMLPRDRIGSFAMLLVQQPAEGPDAAEAFYHTSDTLCATQAIRQHRLSLAGPAHLNAHRGHLGRKRQASRLEHRQGPIGSVCSPTQPCTVVKVETASHCAHDMDAQRTCIQACQSGRVR